MFTPDVGNFSTTIPDGVKVFFNKGLIAGDNLTTPCTGSSFFGMSLPASVQDIDRAGAILEALNSMFRGVITDAYCDVAGFLRDPRKISDHFRPSAKFRVVPSNPLPRVSTAVGKRTSPELRSWTASGRRYPGTAPDAA